MLLKKKDSFLKDIRVYYIAGLADLLNAFPKLTCLFIYQQRGSVSQKRNG